MTLIVAARQGNHIFMTADQQITLQRSGIIVDRASNKLVILRCFDGTALVGYSGLAKIGGLPTGEFIARRLFEVFHFADEIDSSCMRLLAQRSCG